jgi:hypothetical protein
MFMAGPLIGGTIASTFSRLAPAWGLTFSWLAPCTGTGHEKALAFVPPARGQAMIKCSRSCPLQGGSAAAGHHPAEPETTGPRWGPVAR